MGLILELLVVFAVAMGIGLGWQKYRGCGWGEALHRAMVIGMVIMLLYFVGLVITDILDIRPDPGF